MQVPTKTFWKWAEDLPEKVTDKDGVEQKI